MATRKKKREDWEGAVTGVRLVREQKRNFLISKKPRLGGLEGARRLSHGKEGNIYGAQYLCQKKSLSRGRYKKKEGEPRGGRNCA